MNQPANPSSLNENKVVSLHLIQTNLLWLGTWGGGLSQLDLNDPRHTNPQLATFITYRHNPDDPSSISEDSVWAIHQTGDGSLWLGTPMGLNRFDPNTGTFRHYTEKNGLRNNVGLGILEDDSESLAYDEQRRAIRSAPKRSSPTIHRTDCRATNSIRMPTSGRNGIMYIGGINGFNSFHPVNVDNPVPPQVAVTSSKYSTNHWLSTRQS
jgi:hypothetical protein